MEDILELNNEIKEIENTVKSKKRELDTANSKIELEDILLQLGRFEKNYINYYYHNRADELQLELTELNKRYNELKRKVSNLEFNQKRQEEAESAKKRSLPPPQLTRVQKGRYKNY